MASAGEQRILRTAILWLLGLSIVAAPRTFAAAPIDVPAWFVVADATGLSVAFVALWQRRITPHLATAIAVAIAAASALAVFATTTEAVLAGDLSTEVAGSVLLPAVVSVSGMAFLGMRLRAAIAASIAVLLMHPLVVVAIAGDRAGALLTSRGIGQALRFGVTAIALFLAVAVLSAARGRERDAARSSHAEAADRERALRHEQELRRRLHAEAAHELKGPMTIVRVAAQTLESRGQDLDEARRAGLLDIIMRGVDRLDERVTAVARPDDRDWTWGPAMEMPIGAAIATAIDLVDTLGTIDLHLAVDADTRVRVIPEALDHVLENLLANASKYGQPGAPVRILVAEDPEGIAVTVTSAGGGLSDAEAARVFDPRYRGNGAADHADGSGLGLALVRRLVTEWGGRVWCRAEPHRTTFGFTLPAPVGADEAFLGSAESAPNTGVATQ